MILILILIVILISLPNSSPSPQFLTPNWRAFLYSHYLEVSESPGGEVKLWMVVFPMRVLVPTRGPDGVEMMVMFVLPTFCVMAEKDSFPDDPVVI